MLTCYLCNQPADVCFGETEDGEPIEEWFHNDGIYDFQDPHPLDPLAMCESCYQSTNQLNKMEN